MKNTTRLNPSPAPATKLASAAKRASKAPTTSASPEATAKRSAQSDSPGAAARFQTPSTIVIAAKIDVGFGNLLYLRGDGPGLNWTKGLPLQNLASDLWTVALEGASAPIRFKFLLNDESWSNGEDYLAEPGSTLTLTPLF